MAVSLLAWADVEVAASGAARLPGIGTEAEAGALEGAVVDAPGDAAHLCYLGVAQARFLPGLLEGTALQEDVDALGIAALKLRVEGRLRIGNLLEERGLQPRHVVWSEP